MESIPGFFKVFVVIGVILLIVQTKGCSDCMIEGGTPVKGVFGYVCMKQK